MRPPRPGDVTGPLPLPFLDDLIWFSTFFFSSNYIFVFFVTRSIFDCIYIAIRSPFIHSPSPRPPSFSSSAPASLSLCHNNHTSFAPIPFIQHTQTHTFCHEQGL